VVPVDTPVLLRYRSLLNAEVIAGIERRCSHEIVAPCLNGTQVDIEKFLSLAMLGPANVILQAYDALVSSRAMV
jgi:hypothetical protein